MRADDVNVFEEPSALESFQSKLAAVPLRQPDVGSIEPIEQTPAQKRLQGLASLLQRVGYGGGDPRRSFRMSQKLLQTLDPYQQGGIGEFLPGFSYQLAQERGDELGQALATLDLIPGAALGTAAIKAGKAGEGLVTLAHGTTKDAAKQIQKEGAITPKLGSYVEDMYIKRGDYKDVDPFDYPPQAIYFSTADNPTSSISAMKAQIAYKLGKNPNEPVSLKEIEDHGAIVLSDANPKSVFQMDEDDFMTYDLLGNPQSIDEPMGFERNDIISFLPQEPKKILQGKDLVNFVKKNRMEGDNKGIDAL